MSICPLFARNALWMFFFILLSLSLPIPVSAQATDVPQLMFLPNVGTVLEQQANQVNDSKTKGAQVSKISTDDYSMIVGPTLLAAQIIPIRRCDLAKELCETPTAVGAITTAIGTIYSHPAASAIAWSRQMLANAGLAKPTYAQGIGFAALTPFFPLWQATRNIAYSLLIFVMIIIGFMLIFQTQIDAHTIISLQAALPKIILSILMITFSYPIVGLLIDIMYLAIAIMISAFLQGVVIPGTSPHTLSGWNTQQWQSSMMTGGVGTLFSTVIGVGFRSSDDFLKFWAIGAGSTGIGGIIGAMIGTGAAALGIVLGAAVPVAILLLLLGLGLLFAFIRLLVLLANAYIQILISLILGPLLLLSDAIPGHSAFKDWVLNIMANLSVFPATVMVLMFATFLTTSGAGGQWAPPFLPQQSGTGAGFFGAFLGLCIIFLSPNLVVSVKKLFSPKPSLPISTGTIFSPITGGAQTLMGVTQQYYYGKQMFDHSPIGPMLSKLTGKPHGATPQNSE